MTSIPLRLAIAVLRWTVGIVILIQAIHFLTSSSVATELAAMGLPQWIRPALGGFEAAAAVAFLATSGGAFSAYALIVTFAAAALLHVLHGQYDILDLLVYSAAVIATAAGRSAQAMEVMP